VASAGATFGASGAVVVVVTRTSTAVAMVQAAFQGGGKDAMAPTSGWAVLVERLATGTSLSRAGGGTIEATTVAGRVLEETRVPAGASLATAPVTSVCHVLLVPTNAVGASTGASSGSGPASVPSGSPGSGGAAPSS
jgi:hypothetical protein